MARILIVDDEDGLRRVLTRHFTRAGHTVREVGDFTAVREEIDARDYDIVFLDLCMPGMNGGDVCAALRLAQKPDGFELVDAPPVVMMTGYPDLVSVDFVRQLGQQIYCCLVKPFTLVEADEVLECCLTHEALDPAYLDLVAARPAYVS
jgi:DNA-binding response OmpR family regulator